MKKLIYLFICLSVILSAAGCGSNTNTEQTSTEAPTSEVSEVPVAAQSAVSQEVFETPVTDDQLLGKWVNEENSVSIEFFDDGTYVNDSIEGTYTHEDNTLTLTYGGGAVVEDYSVGIRDGQLVLVRDDFQIILDKEE